MFAKWKWNLFSPFCWNRPGWPRYNLMNEWKTFPPHIALTHWFSHLQGRVSSYALFCLQGHRCIIACEEVVADPMKEQKVRENHEEYKSKLCLWGHVLPDPFTLEDGWTGEDNMDVWTSLYFVDTAHYLREMTPSELQETLCSEYKQGKVCFDYFQVLTCKLFWKLHKASQYFNFGSRENISHELIWTGCKNCRLIAGTSQQVMCNQCSIIQSPRNR